jgi:hypothetical protein
MMPAASRFKLLPITETQTVVAQDVIGDSAQKSRMLMIVIIRRNLF